MKIQLQLINKRFLKGFLILSPTVNILQSVGPGTHGGGRKKLVLLADGEKKRQQMHRKRPGTVVGEENIPELLPFIGRECPRQICQVLVAHNREIDG